MPARVEKGHLGIPLPELDKVIIRIEGEHEISKAVDLLAQRFETIQIRREGIRFLPLLDSDHHLRSSGRCGPHWATAAVLFLWFGGPWGP